MENTTANMLCFFGGNLQKTERARCAHQRGLEVVLGGKVRAPGQRVVGGQERGKKKAGGGGPSYSAEEEGKNVLKVG